MTTLPLNWQYHNWIPRLACVLAVWMAGCGEGPQVQSTTQPNTNLVAGGSPETEKKSGDQTGQAAQLAPPTESASDDAQAEEIWEAYYLQGNKVGHAHTVIAQIEENDEKVVRTTSQSQLSLKRLGQETTQKMSFTSWETPTGKLLRFESRLTSGPGEVVAQGAVEKGNLNIEINTQGKTDRQSIPWAAEWGGFFAPDQSLRKSPLKPGETRSIRSLLPLLNIAGDTTLEAADYETVKLPGGERKLLKVQSSVKIGDQSLVTTLWVDDKGETHRSLVAGIGQEALRTTKGLALKASEAGEFDLMEGSIVKVGGTIPDLASAKLVRYRAKIKEGSINGVFPSGLSQQVKIVDKQTAEITVRAIRPDQPSLLTTPIKFEADDLAANSMVQSDDAAVIKMAEGVAPGETNAWKLACALEKHVDGIIHKKNYSTGFATAAEVAQTLEGDCTEHAVLLAALCRARKLPARAVCGLIYVRELGGFAFHMWNEVYITDRWIPMDGTLGAEGIGGDHLKLTDTDLKRSNAYSAMLPVVQVFGNLELEVLQVE